MEFSDRVWILGGWGFEGGMGSEVRVWLDRRGV